MSSHSKHLILYDGNCGFCQQSVQWILKRDTDTLFNFAALQGKNAKKFLKETPSLDTLILIENYTKKPKIYTHANATLRIAWLLGSPYSLIGWLHILPPITINWIYALIAKHRHRLSTHCPLPTPKQKDRFLD